MYISDSFLLQILFIVLKAYNFSPDMLNNILLIYNILSVNLDAELLINFYLKINFLRLNSYMESYKGNYLNNYSDIFINYFNLIFMFFQIDFNNSNFSKEKSAILYEILTENIKSFYKVNFENLENLYIFKEQKRQNIELQEILLKIAANTTSHSKGAVILLKSNFFVDALEILISLAERKIEIKEYENLVEKNEGKLELIYSSMVENSFLLILNFINFFNDSKITLARQDIKDLILGHVKHYFYKKNIITNFKILY